MSKQSDFIKTIASLAQAECKSRKKWVLPSVCIAQAALESGWNLNAKTLFGIKGGGDSLTTTEYINGKYVTTTASFKKYPTLASAVHGYYDLITENKRYSMAVNNNNYQSTIKAIASGGYATDPDYANKIISIIQQYKLTDYDNYSLLTFNEKTDVGKVVEDVIKGVYGNGKARKKNLENVGYDYKIIQQLVNERLNNEKS